jgi:hypothetical protein
MTDGQELIDEEMLQDNSIEADISTADAVSLFNSSLNKAFDRQKAEILDELRKSMDNSSNNTSVSTNNTSACQSTEFEFKLEGTKIQFNFNSERLSALQKIEVWLKAGKIQNVHSIIQSEIVTFRY